MANGLAIAGGSNYWSASGASLSPDSAQGYSNVLLASAGLFMWNSDLTLARLAAASMRQGAAPSATPVAQTFTLGEASRPGTDANVGGANGTIRSGLGTGTGTRSAIIFSTPELAGAGSGVQAYTTRLTIDNYATFTIPVWSSGAGFASFRVSGASNGAVFTAETSGPYGGTLAGLCLGSTMGVTWSTGTDSVATGANDLGVYRLGSSSLRIGFDPNATPLANLLTIGEASRPGTDSNVSGGHGTIRSGLGTGNATGSTLAFQTPTAVAAGSLVQTYTTRLTLSAAGAVFDLVNQGLRINGQTSGAAASAGTLTNAPSAGDPSFWLPINIAGNIRYIPCWT